MTFGQPFRYDEYAAMPPGCLDGDAKWKWLDPGLYSFRLRASMGLARRPKPDIWPTGLNPSDGLSCELGNRGERIWDKAFDL